MGFYGARIAAAWGDACRGEPAVKESSSRTERSQFLSGWKEIANYLGKGVRTVQRYERQMGLPVRRPAGKPWGSVVATKAELDGWVKASPIREVFRLRNPRLEYPSAAGAITNGVGEMVQLRQQMLALRSDLKHSLQSLQNVVFKLQEGLNQGAWKESSPLYSRKERDSLDQSVSRLKIPINYPKAS